LKLATVVVAEVDGDLGIVGKELLYAPGIRTLRAAALPWLRY
jgi:hypothetical protein